MIKKSDWHYKLANFGSKRVWSGDKLDFCRYFRCVMYGLLHAFIVFMMVAIVSVLVLGSLYDFYMWCVYNKPMNEAAIVVIAVLGSALSGTGIGYIIYKYLALTEDKRSEKRRLKRMEELHKEPGFFKMAYRKFKDKTCFMLKVED